MTDAHQVDNPSHRSSLTMFKQKSPHHVIHKVSVPLEKDISIISWNIHDSIMSQEGLKTNDDDFVKVLSQSAIFCLFKNLTPPTNIYDMPFTI